MAFDRFAAMSVFVKVVENGSFARAAERLGMSTSAVSRHVAELETHLATRLLNRTTRRISLTESGQAYLERTLQLLAELEETEAVVSSSTAAVRGTIRMTCSTGFGIPYLVPAIGAFQLRYPEVRFDISTSNRFVDLVEEGLDLAVRIGELGNPNLIARRIAGMHLLACAAPAYLAKHGTPRRPEELVRHNCLTYEYASIKGQWTFREREHKSGERKGGARKGEGERAEIKVRVAGTAHTNSGEMLAALAAEGAGIVFEPDFAVMPLVRAGRLVHILKGFEPPPHNIHAVYPSRRHLSAKVRAFVDFLAERFANRDRWG